MTDQTIPTLIRTARIAIGLTQQELGERVGYTGINAQFYVSGWETGRRRVPRDKVQIVADALGVDPMELL